MTKKSISYQYTRIINKKICVNNIKSAKRRFIDVVNEGMKVVGVSEEDVEDRLLGPLKEKAKRRRRNNPKSASRRFGKIPFKP